MSRKPFVPAALLGKLWRCIIEFEMLQEGDRVLIGLSGGKDSMFLTAALAEVQQYAPLSLTLPATRLIPCSAVIFPELIWKASARSTDLNITAAKLMLPKRGSTAPTRRALPALISAAPPPTARAGAGL